MILSICDTVKRAVDDVAGSQENLDDELPLAWPASVLPKKLVSWLRGTSPWETGRQDK